MANHVEGRTPFLDRDLSAFASTIPPEYLIDIDNLREKNVLHDAFDSISPKATANEYKYPFFAPSWSDILKTNADKEIWDQFLSTQALRQKGLCSVKDVCRLRKIWSIVPKKTVLHRKLNAVMGSVLTLQILHHHFIEKAPLRRADVNVIDMTPGVKSSRI